MASFSPDPVIASAHFVLATLIALVAAGCGGSTAASIPESQSQLTTADPVEAVPRLEVLTTEAGQVAELLGAHELTVMVWWSARCPCVRRYHERIEAIGEEWADADLQIVTVSSNADEGRTEVIEEAQQRGSSYPMLFDVGGLLARQIGVRSTPTVVILNRAGETVFDGWIDNERDVGARGRVTHVSDAISGYFDGTEAADSSPTYGCAIAREARRGCCSEK